MGWTCFAKPQGPGAVVRELQRQFNFETDSRSNRVLRGAFVGLTYYSAVETIIKADGKRFVWACVVLVRYHPTRWQGGPEMCTKYVDEGMGPNESRCPQTILDLLTPVEPGAGSYAQEWRNRCLAYRAKHATPVTTEEVTAWAAKSGYEFDRFSDACQKKWKTVYRNRRASGQL